MGMMHSLQFLLHITSFDGKYQRKPTTRFLWNEIHKISFENQVLLGLCVDIKTLS